MIDQIDPDEEFKGMGYGFESCFSISGPWAHQVWRLGGVLRGPSDKPAVTKTFLPTGVDVLEEWRGNLMTRADGPARIRRDRNTGIVIQEEWFRAGYHHRTGGPAVIKYDKVTGEKTYEGFYENRVKLSEIFYPSKGASLPSREAARPSSDMGRDTPQPG